MRWIECQLFRFAADRGDDVDLFITVVLPGERDPLPVGRKLGKDFLPSMSRKSHRRPARSRRPPKIAGMAENHLVLMDVRKPQQLGLSIAGAAGQQRKKTDDPNYVSRHGAF